MSNMKYLSSLLMRVTAASPMLLGAAVGTNSGRSLPCCCWEEKAEMGLSSEALEFRAWLLF